MYGTVRTATNDVARGYWTILGGTLFIGFLINYLMIQNIPGEIIMAINPWVLIIGYFVIAISGIMISAASDNPWISFIGYLMVVVPVGVVITPFVQKFDPEIVQKAVLFTAVLTAMMTILGNTFTKWFQSIGQILFWALLASIIAEIVMLFLGYKLAIMDWIVAVIFMGFIGYDYAMALDDTPTADAAVDRAVALYLDIINLFIRILSIMGNSDD